MKIIPININSEYLLNSKSRLKNHIINDFKILQFSDGEFCPKIDISVRGEDIVILSDIKNSDDILKTILTIDAVKSSGSKSIMLVLPYMPYMRQDKPDYDRASVGSRVFSNMFETFGVDSIMSVELHNKTIMALYKIPFIHITPYKLIHQHISNLGLDNICIVSPDEGGVKRANKLKDMFDTCDFAMLTKVRKVANQVDSMTLIGDVKNKNVIIFDDMIDTAGTVCKASEMLYKNGATSVRCATAHALLNGNAVEKLNNSGIIELIYTNTYIPNVDGLNVNKTIIDVYPLIEERIFNNYNLNN